MEILNILYSNNLIAVYLIGAILVVILIFIVISSMTTTPKENKKILNDPTEEETILDSENLDNHIPEIKEVSKINEMVEELYQKSIEEDLNLKEEPKDLNTFLEEFDVPNTVIEEVVNVDDQDFNNLLITETPIGEVSDTLNKEPIQEPLKPKENNATEDIETMLKRLYELRQNENDARKSALLNDIYDLKKQIDESLKSSTSEYTLNYNFIDNKVLADYYLFNEDIEFPKLK